MKASLHVEDMEALGGVTTNRRKCEVNDYRPSESGPSAGGDSHEKGKLDPEPAHAREGCNVARMARGNHPWLLLEQLRPPSLKKVPEVTGEPPKSHGEKKKQSHEHEKLVITTVYWLSGVSLLDKGIYGHSTSHL